MIGFEVEHVHVRSVKGREEGRKAGRGWVGE